MHITNATARKCNHEAIATEKSVVVFFFIIISFVATFNSEF